MPSDNISYVLCMAMAGKKYTGKTGILKLKDPEDKVSSGRHVTWPQRLQSVLAYALIVRSANRVCSVLSNLFIYLQPTSIPCGLILCHVDFCHVHFVPYWFCAMLICVMLILRHAGFVLCWFCALFCAMLVLCQVDFVPCWFCARLVLCQVDFVPCWFCAMFTFAILILCRADLMPC